MRGLLYQSEKNGTSWKIAICIGFFFGLLTVSPVRAATTEIFLDKTTLQKGYTIVTEDQKLRLVVPKNALREAATVTIHELEEKVTLPKQMSSVSAFYSIDIEGEEGLEIEEPLIVILNFNSIHKGTPKSIYEFKQPKKKWLKLPTDIKEIHGTASTTLDVSSIKIVVLERTEFRIPIDPNTPQPFLVARHDDLPDLHLEIPKEAVKEKSIVVITTVEDKDILLPPGLEIMGEVLSFSILSSKPIELEEPIALYLHYDQEENAKKIIYFFNRNRQAWVRLFSESLSDRKVVKGDIHLSEGEVVLLKNPSILEEGYASWYRSKRFPMGAASNDWPLETKLRVTSLVNHRSVVVTVVSRGPFVTGRIIDLADGAFRSIAHLYRDGVIRVKVEEL